MPALSVCLIVKNEDAHLARCLESVRSLADEIVVVDTGSTDGTIDIARRSADRVVSFAWCDDFAAARNFALEHAGGDWVLSLDADETIAARDHARIRAALDRDCDAVESFQRHYLIDGLVVGWTSGSGGYDEGRPYPGFLDVQCRRLFRRKAHLRWRNPVHEELVSIDPARPVRAVADTWVIHHFGKTDAPERLAAKADMYLRLGVRKAAEMPADQLAQYELGIQLQELQRWGEALEAFERTTALGAGFRESDFYIAICLTRLGRQTEALRALARARRSTPASAAEICLEQGNVHLAGQNLKKAGLCYRRALGRKPQLGAASFNLGILALRSGERDAARAWLDRALKDTPFNRDARFLRATLSHEDGRTAAALGDLRVVSRDPRAARLLARIHLEAGDAAAAARALNEAQFREGGPAGNGEHQALAGAIALAQGRTADARAALEAAWPDSQTVETALNLAGARLATGDSGGALAAVSEALRLDPDHATALQRHRTLAPIDQAPAPLPHGRPLRVFFWHRDSLDYDGRTPRTTGLGGTESAVVYLAEELARRGHAVAIFNRCDQPSTVEGVEYAPWRSLPPRAAHDRPDVVVSVRHWQPIDRARFAPLQIFWTGDAHDQPYLDGIAASGRNSAVDLVVLQSQWQSDTIQQAHGIAPWRIVRMRYGYGPRPDAPAREEAAPRPRRLAYTSTPFRGLDVLLELFPRIRARCPDAELKVFSSMRVYGMNAADDRATFDDIYRRANQPGVELVGSVAQPVLARELEQCRLLAYPNHWAETFCIAAIEAQAAGCPVLTSAVGALPETVGDGGLCLHGDPRSSAFQDAFVDAAVQLLGNDTQWQALSARARGRAVPFYGWTAIGADWERMLRAARGHEHQIVDRVVSHLVAGRTALAAGMMSRSECPAEIEPAAWRDLADLAARLAAGRDVPSALASAVVRQFGAVRRAHVVEAALSARFTEGSTVARNRHAS